MKLKFRLILLGFLVLIMFIPGVFANWVYAVDVGLNEQKELGLGLSEYQWIGPSTASTIIYITDAKQTAGTGSAIINGYKGTHLNSSVSLVSQYNSTVTLQITVYNSSDQTYAYNATEYALTEYSNQDIVVTTPNLNHGDKINGKSSMTFNAVFSFAETADKDNLNLDSIINFEFLPHEELPEEEIIAVHGALEQFKNIINNVVRPTSYNELISQMDKHATNDRFDESYIGNVVGASADDEELLDDLFQGNLKINIDGVPTEVTVIIKREDVDGNKNTGDANGNEMSIYLTTDALERDSWWSAGTAPVYVAVFTSDNDGKLWYQLGDMYEGTATVKGYDGNVFGEGSFDTDSWRTKNNAGIRDNQTISTVIKNLK